MPGMRSLGGNRVGIGIPVLAELAFGLEQSTSRDRNMQRLRAALPARRVWPFDNNAALEIGQSGWPPSRLLGLTPESCKSGWRTTASARSGGST